ncbi:unnamed protein product, partial [Closterium sp. NIES-54]
SKPLPPFPSLSFPSLPLPFPSPPHYLRLPSPSHQVAAATAFGLGIGFVEGPTKASEFFAGYLLEQSLSVDNLFVFVLIFSYFKVPTAYQPRVLTYGIAGAVIFRAIMIGLGIAAIQAFEAVNLLFAAVLIFSSYKLLAEAEDEDDDLSNNSVVKFCQKLIPITVVASLATPSSSSLPTSLAHPFPSFSILFHPFPSFSTLLHPFPPHPIPSHPTASHRFSFTPSQRSLESLAIPSSSSHPTSLAHPCPSLPSPFHHIPPHPTPSPQFDSIPAVFGVTRDPFIVFTSNIFAILGLRSLFTVIATSMADLHYLQPAIAVVLGFIGTKILAEFCGLHVPTEVSLGVVASLLAGGVFFSLRFPLTEGDDKEGL